MSTVELDHVFICVEAGADAAARALAGAGLAEGAPNVHPGQGTANRRFFFENAYLELLFVRDEVEARAEPGARTRLWERWSNRDRGACPFGVGFRPAREPCAPPFDSWRYAPGYFGGVGLDMAAGLELDEPEIFHMGFARRPDPARCGAHAAPVRTLREAAIALPRAECSRALRRALDALPLVVVPGPEFLLTLRFGETASVDLRPDLPLVLRY